MSIKEKLLSAINDLPYEEISNERLVDILVDKLKSQREEIKKLENANLSERRILSAETERIMNEYKELNRNPNKFLSFTEYFIGKRGLKIICSFHNGYLSVSEVEKAISFAAKRVSPEEFQGLP